MEYVPVVGIAVVLFVLAELLKRTVLKNNADMKAVLPFVCALIGAIAGVICFIIDPTMIPGAANALDAILAGAISGLVATGSHQIYKQFVNLVTIGKSTSEDIKEEVENMTTEEKKEYLTDVATEMITDVLNKTNGVEETDTGNAVKDPTTSESLSNESAEATEDSNK